MRERKREKQYHSGLTLIFRKGDKILEEIFA
jgi:hypothetical protein